MVDVIMMWIGSLRSLNGRIITNRLHLKKWQKRLCFYRFCYCELSMELAGFRPARVAGSARNYLYSIDRDIFPMQENYADFRPKNTN